MHLRSTLYVFLFFCIFYTIICSIVFGAPSLGWSCRFLRRVSSCCFWFWSFGQQVYLSNYVSSTFRCSCFFAILKVLIIWPRTIFAGGPQPVSWATRIKVAIGAAKGLAFLHDAESQVIYRDFKASNILLDAVCSESSGLNIMLHSFICWACLLMFLFILAGIQCKTIRFWFGKGRAHRRSYSCVNSSHGHSGLCSTRVCSYRCGYCLYDLKIVDVIFNYYY